jgi:hypothetical protein
VNRPEPATVVQDAAADSVESLCGLFRSVFGQAVEPSAWRWKYQDPALLGHHNVILSEAAGGTVLGHAGAILLPGICRGRPVPMAQLCDIMLAREARGRPVPNGPYARFVKALIAQLRERIPEGLYYGFPGQRPFRLGERLGLYRGIGPIREWRLPAQAGKIPRRPFLRLRELDWDDERIDRLWERRLAGYPDAMLVRNRRYLSWRYARHPFRAYRLLGVYPGLRFGPGRDKDLQGWVVAREEGEVLRCIDRLIDETRLGAVLDRLARWGMALGARETAFWAGPGGPLEGAVEHDTGLIGVVLPASAAEFAAARPYWQPGDADIY